MDNLLYALYLVHKYVVLLNIPSMLQAELRSKDAQNSDLQENVKSQQAEAAKAKEEMTQALTEEALKPVAEELAGLKRQINAMTYAIFGKYLLMYVASVNES